MHIKHIIFILYILPPFPGGRAAATQETVVALLDLCAKKMLSSFIFLKFEL